MSETTKRRGLWLLIAALLIVLGFTGFYVVRSVSDYLFWQQHRDEPIQPWMTLGFVAHSYHVPPHVLHLALGLPVHPPDHRPLWRIAAAQGTSFTLLDAKLHLAIVHARPPYPPPLPPPPDRPAT